MTLNEYQEQAMTTCMESSHNFGYMMLNLVGEVGELASKVAKSIRKSKVLIDGCDIVYTHIVGGMTPEEFKGLTKENCQEIAETAMKEMATMDEEWKKEAGDILWQLAGLCKVMGWSLEEVAALNLEKLAARKEAGTIDGNGDGINGAERTK